MAAAALLVVAVVAPAAWPGAEDDFPLSTYPMFTAERERVVDLDTAVRIDGDRRERLSPEAIAGTDEPVLAASTVSRAVAGGPAAVRRLCAAVAARLDGSGIVQIRTETHDTVAFLRDGAPPLAVQVHGDCPVER